MLSKDELTPRARKLYTALQEHGDWVSRGELARVIGQPRLTLTDTGAIEIMAQKELIEIRKRHIPHKGMVVEYKAKS